MGAKLAIVIQRVSITFRGNTAQDDNYRVKPTMCEFFFLSYLPAQKGEEKKKKKDKKEKQNTNMNNTAFLN